MKNIPSDKDILAAVNERARLYVNADTPGEPPYPPGFRCDISRVGFIRDRWRRAVQEYKNETGLDVIEALGRIEAELRSPINVPQLYVERR